MHKNIDDAIDSMYQIERTLLRRKLERSSSLPRSKHEEQREESKACIGYPES